jgi:hypothetical protein
MGNKALVLSFAALLTLGAPAAPAQERTFTIGLELLGAAPFAPADTWEMLRIFNYDVDDRPEGGVFVEGYGTRYDSIDNNPGWRAAPRLELLWRDGNREVGVSALWYGAGDGDSGRVSSPAPVFSGGGIRFTVVGPCIPGVPFRCLVPTIDERRPSGFSDVTWRTQADFDVAVVTALWRPDTSASPGLGFGLRFGYLNDETSYQVDMEASVADFDETPDAFFNQITISASQRARFWGIGPYLSLAGRAGAAGRGLSYELGAGVLLGRAELSGFWHDEDRISITDPAGNVVEEIYFDGRFPYDDSSARALPVADLRIALDLPLSARTMGRIGLHTSVLFGAPVAPLWSVPGAWTALDASSWVARDRTVVLGGIFFGAAFDL